MLLQHAKTATAGRRAFLGGVALAALTGRRALADATTTLPLPGGPGERAITTGFPGKGPMILQRTRPPLLETPFEVFDRGVFTPNDQFFVRWHWAVIPTEMDVHAFRLGVTGHVNAAQSLTLQDILGLPRVELAAVNQCSGNSRGYFAPRVPGGEWSNGAMGNAKWMGVRLRDVLDRAGVKAGAQRVRFAGMDDPVVADAPKFMKSLDIDHARDGEVMLAYAMNGEQLPLLHGAPLRLVVPGWYSTYWVKMVSRIEVLDGPDENFWTKVAYTIPDTPGADMKPGEAGVKMVPINRMVPRSFVTNLADGARVKARTRPGARHRPGRRRRRARRRGLDRRRRELETRHARRRRGPLQLPRLAGDARSAGRRRRADGARHQHGRAGAAGDAELESQRLHAQRDRDDPPRGGLIPIFWRFAPS
jgi:DMSO/TMAO reductase YedYZ molybdopterin-dependent catalytic subunit